MPYATEPEIDPSNYSKYVIPIRPYFKPATDAEPTGAKGYDALPEKYPAYDYMAPKRPMYSAPRAPDMPPGFYDPYSQPSKGYIPTEYNPYIRDPYNPPESTYPPMSTSYNYGPPRYSYPRQYPPSYPPMDPGYQSYSHPRSSYEGARLDMPSNYYAPPESNWPPTGLYSQYDPRYYGGEMPTLAKPMPMHKGYTGRGPMMDKGQMYSGMGSYGMRTDMRARAPFTGGPAQRNEFLEDFKQKITYMKVIELAEIKGHIVELAKDQFGSRYLQTKIEKSSKEEKQVIFEEIKGCAYELMSDVFGNYVIQKLIEEGGAEYRTALIEKMEGKVKKLSLDIYGCRCVQKAIESGTSEQKISLLNEIKSSVGECVESQNANHVLQKCIETVPVEHIAFLLDYAMKNVKVKK